ncbi:MAG: hypothetical protein EOM68_09125 [Spirochaetia bacterium]|nr:hypothetical protein [Spirochaetia bacterium]
MKTYTVSYDPEQCDWCIAPGFLVSRRGDGLFVRLGGMAKFSNSIDIPLFKGNIPVMDEKGGELFVMDAFPMVLKGGEHPLISLASPAEDTSTRDIILVRFNFGIQRPISARGIVWPESGEPHLVAYSCTGDGNDVCPTWFSDSIWTLTNWDTMRIGCGDSKLLFKSNLTKESV